MKLPSTLLASLLLLSGCTVGPNYHQPTSATAPAFKESAVVPPPDLPGGGWKQVTPNDSAIRPNWWEIYQDPQLNKLEEQVAVSNQTLKASYEQYMQARAADPVLPFAVLSHGAGWPFCYARAPVAKPSLVCSRQQEHLQRHFPAGRSFLGA